MHSARMAALGLAGAFLLVPLLARANRGGPTSGNSGDPVFNNNCTQCHQGNPLNLPGVTLAISGPGITGGTGVYEPGTFIPLEVSMTGQVQSQRAGYQMSAWKRPAGSFADLLRGWTRSNINQQRLITDHISHSSGGNLQHRWWQYFQVPTTAQNFTCYCAGNDTNDNNRNTGDRIRLTKVDFTPGVADLSLRAIPRPGSPVQIDLHAPSEANKPYVLAASFGNSGIPIGGNRVVPLALDNLFLLTALNQVPALFQNYTGILDVNGRATATLVVAPIPQLAGVVVHHAYIVLDGSAPNGISFVSFGLPVLII